MTDGRIITTVCLLTDDELALLGAQFNRAWPIEQAPCFSGLLQAIDDAERDVWRSRDKQQAAACIKPTIAETF